MRLTGTEEDQRHGLAERSFSAPSRYRRMHYSDEVLYCGRHLEDDSWIGGYLKSFNTDVEEGPDRELVLTQPRYRGPEADEAIDRHSQRQTPDVPLCFVCRDRD